MTGYDWKGFRLLMRHFWHRLFGSAGVWFCNDWVSLQAQSICTVQAPGILFQNISLHCVPCMSVDTLHLQYFYGNGVFRSTFVGILIGPKASVLQNWFYSWINSGVQVRGMGPC